MVTILMMSAKMATLGLLKIKLFWNNSYDVIISDYDVTNKIVSCDSNYIVGVVMWPKFSNFNFIRFDHKNHFYWEIALVQVQQFETGTRSELEILHQCGKRVKNKSQKVLGDNSYVCKSYMGKTGRGRFGSPSSPSWIGLREPILKNRL